MLHTREKTKSIDDRYPQEPSPLTSEAGNAGPRGLTTTYAVSPDPFSFCEKIETGNASSIATHD
jgi:hypothetical protein